MEWYVGPLKKYADFNGRASRKEYWLFSLWQFGIYLFLIVLEAGSNAGFFGLLYVIYAIGTFIPTLAVAVRRFHDTEKAGAWLFILLIPFIGAIVMFVFLVSTGTPGNNKYGPNPLVTSNPSGLTPPTGQGPGVVSPPATSPAPTATAPPIPPPAAGRDTPSPSSPPPIPTPPTSPGTRPTIEMDPTGDEGPITRG